MIPCLALAPLALSVALAARAPVAASGGPPPYTPYASTYADSVLRYDPAHGGGCTPSALNFTNPQSALGRPDYSGGAQGTGAVSLGSGGLLELHFGGWQIANSGDSRSDLQITEIGGYGERCLVALRPVAPTTAQDLVDLGLHDADQDGFFEIGGSVSSGEFDLDALFNRVMPAATVRFDAIQIIDDIADTPSCTSSAGADIDAVGAAQTWVAVAPASWGRVKSLYRD